MNFWSIFNFINFRPKISLVDEETIMEDFVDQIKNETARLAIFMHSDNIRLFSYLYEVDKIELKERLFSTPMGFGYVANHFMAELREETLQLLIPAGIPQYLIEYYPKFYYPPYLPDKKGPSVLNMGDLSFGFIICLIAAAFAIAAFLIEIFVYFVRKGVENLIGLYAILNGLRWSA